MPGKAEIRPGLLRWAGVAAALIIAVALLALRIHDHAHLEATVRLLPGTTINISRAELAAARTELAGRPMKPQQPTVFFVLRTYAGDKRGVYAVLQSLDCFLPWGASVHFTIILDSESSADRLMGKELDEWCKVVPRNCIVRYAEAPSNNILLARPFYHVFSRMNSSGYTRQLYDTFWLDKYLPPWARPGDLIALLDADSSLRAVIAPSALHQNNVLLRPAMSPSHWKGEHHFLGEPVLLPYDVMWPDVMPQLFWVGTLAAVRAAVTARIRQPATAAGFDAAWIALFNEHIGNQREISPVNVIFNYGVKHESHRYAATVVAPAPLGSKGPGVPCFSSNRPRPQDSFRFGCCRAFRLPGCSLQELTDDSHITFVNNVEQWPSAERARIANVTYAQIHELLARLPANDTRRMVHACINRDNSLGRPLVPHM